MEKVIKEDQEIPKVISSVQKRLQFKEASEGPTKEIIENNFKLISQTKNLELTFYVIQSWISLYKDKSKEEDITFADLERYFRELNIDIYLSTSSCDKDKFKLSLFNDKNDDKLEYELIITTYNKEEAQKMIREKYDFLESGCSYDIVQTENLKRLKLAGIKTTKEQITKDSKNKVEQDLKGDSEDNNEEFVSIKQTTMKGMLAQGKVKLCMEEVDIGSEMNKELKDAEERLGEKTDLKMIAVNNSGNPIFAWLIGDRIVSRYGYEMGFINDKEGKAHKYNKIVPLSLYGIA